jgi:hypothetical protein
MAADIDALALKVAGFHRAIDVAAPDGALARLTRSCVSHSRISSKSSRF